MFFPTIDPLIYFDKKLGDYHVIGYIDIIRNTLYPYEDKKDEMDVYLFIVKVYAGTPNYFKSQKVPLSYAEYKKRFSKSFPVFAPIQPLKIITDKKYKYIEDSMKQKKDHFLADLGGVLYKTAQIKDKQERVPTDLFWAILPAIKREFEKLPKNNIYSYGKFYKYFGYSLWENTIGEENEMLMSKDEFDNAVSLPGFCIYRMKNKTELLDGDLEQINKVISAIPLRSNPLIDFAYSFFDSFLQFLQNKKLLRICPTCNKVFRYKYNRIYCDTACAKRMHHKRYYPKHRQEILIKAKNSMKELRLCYKKYGACK